METLDEIIPKLFLGGIGAAKNSEYLAKLSVKAILTIDIQPLPAKYTDNFLYKFIHAEDSNNQNLLVHFDDCFDFISNHMQSGYGVLVHCFQGVSRSSTIVISYIMKSKNISLQQALQLVSKKRLISPNSGFIKQLKLYDGLKCQLNFKDPSFIAFRLNQFAKNMIETYEFFEKNDFPETLFAIDPLYVECNQISATVFKCRQCRRDLFYESSYLPHSKKYGYLEFEYKNFYNNHQGVETEAEMCTEFLYIEPVAWMREQICSLISGKLHCPKCQSKLGSFNWSGEKCGCQTWVTPAFHIQNSKVDRVVAINDKLSSN